MMSAQLSRPFEEEKRVKNMLGCCHLSCIGTLQQIDHLRLTKICY
jgi:hypothetical protein